MFKYVNSSLVTAAKEKEAAAVIAGFAIFESTKAPKNSQRCLRTYSVVKAVRGATFSSRNIAALKKAAQCLPYPATIHGSDDACLAYVCMHHHYQGHPSQEWAAECFEVFGFDLVHFKRMPA